MSSSVPSIDPDQLTDALRRAGVLHSGRVSNLRLDDLRPTILSRIGRVHLTYDGPADGAPTSLFLKTGLPERLETFWRGYRHEADFYSKVAPHMPLGVVPRYFDAHFDEETHDWRLIIEDLTETHETRTIWPLPPTPEDCEQIISAWGRLHAAWWNAPALGNTIGSWPDPTEALIQAFAEKYEAFAKNLGERLSPERRETYRALIKNGYRLTARARSRQHMTIVHGDAHPWNIMLPKREGETPRIFDWDGWRVDVAASDIAYMMSVHWFPDYRRRYERAMLDLYHEELMKGGVANYDRRTLQDDYRLATLWRLATPVGQYSGKIPAGIWWNHLDRIFSAIDDLDCRELL
jgi:thiamine kinase-like enzyme